MLETFDNLDKYHLKVSPTKYFFGVPAGQLLRFFGIGKRN
jgi:hypothetical protein